jgi:hypothetical protein
MISAKNETSSAEVVASALEAHCTALMVLRRPRSRLEPWSESAVLLHRAVGPIVRFEQFPNTLWIMLFDSGDSPRTITR